MQVEECLLYIYIYFVEKLDLSRILTECLELEYQLQIAWELDWYDNFFCNWLPMDEQVLDELSIFSYILKAVKCILHWSIISYIPLPKYYKSSKQFTLRVGHSPYAVMHQPRHIHEAHLLRVFKCRLGNQQVLSSGKAALVSCWEYFFGRFSIQSAHSISNSSSFIINGIM